MVPGPGPIEEFTPRTAEEVQELTARLKAQQAATCAEVVRLQKFLQALGVEPTGMKGGYDDCSTNHGEN